MDKAAYPDSYYAATRNCDVVYPSLQGELEVDVCICGGGFTGIATALSLVERGYSVAVLEQHRIGWGASGRNGGQFIGGFSGDGEMLRQLGPGAADLLWDIGWRGNTIIAARVASYGIDCDLKYGYMDVALKPRHMRQFESYHDELLRRGFGNSVRMVSREEMPSVIGSEAYIGGLINTRSGHLHPLNLCLGEARAAAGQGVHIFERSEALGIRETGSRVMVSTGSGQVNAGAAVLAGNAYQQLEVRKLRGQVFPAGSYIIATEPLGAAEAAELNPLDMAFCDPNHVLDYFRLSADRRMLFGGRCNYSGREPRSIRASIEPRMQRIFPQLRDKRVEYQWGGNIGIVLNRVPLLGRLGDKLYYALGYSGHGVNMTHASGEILAEAIAGDTRKLELFERVRHPRIPFGKALGSQVLALGMLYYRLLDLL
ncbi:MAG: FAD-binding oxidoreductase [Halieaceae bacterium]|nr:FAD-binding oxidoreductase [Halieaceae bacterium]